MAPVELEIQSDSEVESVSEEDSDSDRSSEDSDLFEDVKQEPPTSGTQKVKDIASGDTLRIRLWKVFVLFTMAVITSCLSAGAYYFLKKEENDDYHDNVSAFFMWTSCRVAFGSR